ncbi:MAG: hypothetical protein ABH864_05205 [archaeon]
MKKTKDTIVGDFDVLIKQQKTEEKSRLFACTKVEYLHDKKEDFFDHHLMFYKGKTLIFKVWLPNSKTDKPFKNVSEALESVGMGVLK